jgi:hypothetical protein
VVVYVTVRNAREKRPFTSRTSNTMVPEGFKQQSSIYTSQK